MPSIYGLNASCPVGGSSEELLQHVVCIFTCTSRKEGIKDLKSVKTDKLIKH